MSESDHRFGVAEPGLVTLEVGRYCFLALVVALYRMADLLEGPRTAVGGIGLGVVVIRKVAVGEDNLAAVDWRYGEEVHMAAAAVERMLVVEDKDCVRRHRMVAVGNPDCTGLGVYILPAAAVMEVVDLVGILRVPRILEGVRQVHRSPAGAGNLVVGNSEADTGLAGTGGILLANSE